MNKKIFSLISLLILLLIFARPIFAYSGDTTANPTTGTSIVNQNCLSTYPIQITAKNYGSCGVLCWYKTEKTPDWIKGTQSCIPPWSGQITFNANIEMLPSGGSETRTLNIECHDFCKDLFADNCNPNNQYSTTYYSKLNWQFSYNLRCDKPSFSLSSAPSSLSLYCGKSGNINVNIKNSGTNPISCSFLTNCPSCSLATNTGTLPANSELPLVITVTAPSQCTASTNNYVLTATCSDTSSQVQSAQSASFSISFTPNPCDSALSDARSAISDAQNAITNAQSKIREANNIGADITSSQASLNQANSQLSTAQTSLSTAQGSCNTGDTTNGVNQANSAKNSADQSKQYATTALNGAQQSITEFTKKKTEASNKISDANSAIDNTVIMINKAGDILDNATALSTVMPEALGGLDLAAHKSNINTARAKIDQAKNYVTDAQTTFDQKNFDLAKSKADSASQLANDANNLATDSYTKINTVMSTLGEAAKAIMAANSEISQTDEILTKMDYVISSVEKWNVILTEAKDIVTTGKTNIDTAKDLLSQAKNRLQAGVSTESVTKAIEARDKAAEPANRLERIVSSISTNTQDALGRAYSDAESKVNAADTAVKDAQTTYMATQSEITAAQNDLANAKSQLSNASTAISDVKTATDLTTFLSKASLAFSALDNVKDKVNSATSHANAAKMGMYMTVGGVTAVGAGAAGGGFLYWKKRKKTEKMKTEKGEEKVEEKKPKGKEKEKPKGKFCKKCGTNLEKGVKFCPKCGNKV